MSLVACRFNPNHRVKSSRLIIHEKKCPDRFNGRAIQSEDDPNLKIIVGSHNDSSIYNNSSIKRACDSRYYEKIKENNIKKEKETEDKFEQLRKQMYKDQNDYEQIIQSEKNNNNSNMFKNKKKKKNKNNTFVNNNNNLFDVKIREIKNDNKDNHQLIDDNFDFIEDEKPNEISNNETINKVNHNKSKYSNKDNDFEKILNVIKYDEEDFIKINTDYDPNEELEKIMEINTNYFMI